MCNKEKEKRLKELKAYFLDNTQAAVRSENPEQSVQIHCATVILNMSRPNKRRREK